GAVVKARRGAPTKLEPLVQSSPDSMLLDAEQMQMMPDPAGIMNAFQPSGQSYALAARVSGPAKSAFPDGPPAPPRAADADAATANAGSTSAGNTTAPPALKQSSQPIN